MEPSIHLPVEEQHAHFAGVMQRYRGPTRRRRWQPSRIHRCPVNPHLHLVAPLRRLWPPPPPVAMAGPDGPPPPGDRAEVRPSDAASPTRPCAVVPYPQGAAPANFAEGSKAI